ncbi:MAG: hypothetical protein HY319_18910 [Armatimonadetes bacterium]|nr:hypothetical protein [Armatimonadota bacterium]
MDEILTTTAQPSDATVPLPQRDETVRCSACTHTITHNRAAIEVDGSHEHTFRNPAGYSFHVLCFSEAPGCLTTGVPTSEASWFRGFQWCYSLCAACHQHLGWRYLSTQRSFEGLIATRLLRPR